MKVEAWRLIQLLLTWHIVYYSAYSLCCVSSFALTVMFLWTTMEEAAGSFNMHSVVSPFHGRSRFKLMYAFFHMQPDVKWMCSLKAVTQWQRSPHHVCHIFWPVVTNYDKCRLKPNTQDAVPHRSQTKGTIHTFLLLLTTREGTRGRRDECVNGSWENMGGSRDWGALEQGISHPKRQLNPSSRGKWKLEKNLKMSLQTLWNPRDLLGVFSI